MTDVIDYILYREMFPQDYEEDTLRYHQKFKYAFDTNEAKIVVDLLQVYEAPEKIKQSEAINTLVKNIEQSSHSLTLGTLVCGYKTARIAGYEDSARRIKSIIDQRNLSAYHKRILQEETVLSQPQSSKSEASVTNQKHNTQDLPLVS